MIKQHSWTRQQYDHAYRIYRRDAHIHDEIWFDNIPAEISRAADYSYQAYGYDPHGWSNDARRKRFHAIKYRAFAYAEDIPF